MAGFLIKTRERTPDDDYSVGSHSSSFILEGKHEKQTMTTKETKTETTQNGNKTN